MAVVRDLLVRIGFVTNKQTQNAVNKSIKQTKTNLSQTAVQANNLTKTTAKAQKGWWALNRRMVLGWVGALYAVKKFFNFFNTVAVKVLDNDILARSIGLAREELLALNSAARQFGFKDNQFAGVLAFLDKMNMDVKNGVTSFQKLNQQLRINIDPNGSSLDTLRTILEGVKLLDDEKTRIDFLNGLFPGLGVQLSDLSKDLNNFEANVERIKIRNQSDKVPIETFREYTTALDNFSDAFDRFIVKLGVVALPVLTKSLSVLEALLSIRYNIFDFQKNLITGNFSGLKENLNFLNPIFSNLDSAGKSAYDFLFEKLSPTINNLLPASSLGNSMSPVNVNLNNTFQVPIGTTSEQALSISGEIESQIVSAMNRVFINIQNNNPQVE